MMSLRTGSLTIVCGLFCNFLIHLFAPAFLGSAPAEALPVPASGLDGHRFTYAAHPINWYAPEPRARRVAAPSRRRTHQAPQLDRDERDGSDCKRLVRGLGTQWIGKEGALDAAKKDWMERVRYDFGESFLDMGNAQEAVVTCGRVSIGEVANQVMYRCEIIARPCQGRPHATQLETK